MTPRYSVIVAAALLLVSCACIPGLVAAQEDPDEEDQDDGGDTIVNVDLDPVTDAVNDAVDEITGLPGEIGEEFVDGLVRFFGEPAKWLAEKLTAALTSLFVWYPDVRMEEVREIHGLVFQLALLLSSAALAVIGFLHITGTKHGFRPAAYLFAAVAAGAAAPDVLWVAVEISRVSTVILQPDNPSLIPTIRVSIFTLIVLYLEVFVILGVALVFVIRNFYLLFYVSSSPLIFLGYLFGHTKKYSTSLTGMFVGFLVIGPLEMIGYRLLLALLNVEGGSTPVDEWLIAVGGFSMMLALPIVILSSATGFAAPLLGAAAGTNIPYADQAKNKAKTMFNDRVREPAREKWESGKDRAKNRFLNDQDDDDDDKGGGD